MVRTKKTAKRAREEEIAMEQPPQEDPMAKYFTNLVDFNNYQLKFAQRKEITPRYLDMALLQTQNFHNLHRILTKQHLLDFVKLKDRFYPMLAAIAYTTLSFVYDEEKPSSFTMTFHLGTTKYELSVGDLCSLGQLNFSGTLFKHGDNPPPQWNFDRLQACQFFNLNPNCGNKIPTKPMIDEYRTLHYLLVWVILPRNNNHGVVTDDDLPILWALVNDLEINWSYFISQHMKKLQEGPITSGLGEILKIKEINHNLKFKKLEHTGSSHDAPQPSMLDLMQVLQRIEQNQANMDHRLQRIEQYLNINEEDD
ncbi:hypothetical protein PIB30_043902 [Stylosanthes scabra]|uniref:Uncharacterized protein n=1 Tax=Stylosanthes scabra TaxID=79078 RepID=A0ABU6TFD0_9FABA|nr:hypothetical protein [Stylosanthes scabra]